jgi:hypothetical protein
VGLSVGGLKRADRYLEQYRAIWEGRLNRLETFLENNK